VRRGFLETVPAGEGESGGRFQRLAWPPPVAVLEGDGAVIGLAYYLQKWFRFGLQDWITQRSRELEAKDGVYSLEDWNATRALNSINTDPEGGHNPRLEQVVSADGDYQDAAGTRLSADIGMMRKPLDISRMTLDLVNSTATLELDCESSSSFVGLPFPRLVLDGAG
jgi:hypothetical protein